MHNWRDYETTALLTVRGSEGIRQAITGTVKDSAVYERITKLLAEREVYRSHTQVISKLKSLRKQFAKYHQLQARGGGDGGGGGGGRGRRDRWPFYELCLRIWNPMDAHGSPASPPASTSSPPPPETDTVNSDDHHEVVVGLWDDMDESEASKRLAPVEPDDDEQELSSPSDRLQGLDATYTIPSKKRKTTIMDQVSTLVSATVAQLKEMDAAMQSQEDARLQRLMDHEKEMQNSLMSQLMAMHDRISRENHERQVQLVDRILSRLPSSSAPSGE